MKHFLMCEPSFFEVCYVINPRMEGNLGKVNKALSRKSVAELNEAFGKYRVGSGSECNKFRLQCASHRPDHHHV